MEAIEAEAESSESDAALGFLQRHSVQKHEPASEDGARQLIISLLKGKGGELKSTLLVSLATQIAADPFAKIKKLIQELIERLLTEAANESNQKGWLDGRLSFLCFGMLLKHAKHAYEQLRSYSNATTEMQ